MRCIAKLIVLTAFLASCDDRPNQWDAFVYPDVENMESYQVIKGFKTFELCQQASLEQLRSSPTEGDYECGYKCGPNEDYGGINVCKETRN